MKQAYNNRFHTHRINAHQRTMGATMSSNTKPPALAPLYFNVPDLTKVSPYFANICNTESDDNIMQEYCRDMKKWLFCAANEDRFKTNESQLENTMESIMMREQKGDSGGKDVQSVKEMQRVIRRAKKISLGVGKQYCTFSEQEIHSVN